MGWIKEERRKRTKEDQARVSGREKGGKERKMKREEGKGQDKRGGKWKIENQTEED